jgi:hypothetical protein
LPLQLLGIIGRRRFRRRRALGFAEAALIAWGAASLAGLIALGVIHASGGFADRVAADAEIAYADDALRLAALAAPPAAPLPRARPPEPMFTGSIRPAVEARNGLIEAVRQAPKGGLVELRRRYELTKRVASVTEPAEDWDGVEEGSWDGEAPPAQAGLLLGDAEAIRACEDGLRAGLPIPSSLKRIAATTGVYRAPGDDAVVTFDFEAVNGFGYPLALQAHCVFDGYSLADLDMVPR